MPRLRRLAPSAALAAALALAALAPPPAGALELDARAREGKALFLSGSSPSGRELTARLGRDGASLPAAAVPCGSCHGADGLGRPEGATRPPAITWSELAKAYGHVHEGGRRHGPFDARTLARALREGLDPAGNPLDPTMPRYALDEAELASLLAYLKVLERDLDPGVSPAALRIGTVLPTRGPTAELGRVVRAVLEQELAALGAAGGLHGRRLTLVVEGYDAGGGARGAVAAARRLLERGDVLALVSGFFPEAEEEVLGLASAAGVPVVGPITSFAAEVESPSPWVFHLLSGVQEQGRVLADFAAERLGPDRPRAAVLHGPGAGLAGAARAAAARLTARGFGEVELVPLADAEGPRLAAGLAAREAGVVLFLGGDGALAPFLSAAAEAGFAPLVLVPGGLAARAALDAPAALRGRIFLAFPVLPGAARPEAAARLARLDLPAGQRSLAAPAHADAALAVLVEGLRRTGRAVSRRALVTALEGLWRFDPGLLPPVTYGPRRRIGALGAQVVAADLERRRFTPEGPFRTLE